MVVHHLFHRLGIQRQTAAATAIKLATRLEDSTHRSQTRCKEGIQADGEMVMVSEDMRKHTALNKHRRVWQFTELDDPEKLP